MDNVLTYSNKQKTIVYLIIIGMIGLGIRLYHYPFELPLTQDAIETYFLYAIETRQLSHLPTDWSPANNMWPAFLGLTFHLFSLENNMIFFMHLQRIISILFSILTLIPMYFLCKKFNNSKLSILGAAFFVLDPRIIHNSLFGITESLYFLLGISSIVLILNQKRKYAYLSFVLIAITTLVRAEGIFILATISVIYFIQFRRNKKKLLEYGILLGLFVLVILPMSAYRIDVTGNDWIFGRASDGIVRNIESDTKNNIFPKMVNSAETYFKYLGWIMIPNFILFVPIGFLLLIKKKNFQTFFIIVSSMILSIPAIGAYSNQVLETRYLYILLPMFSLLALLTIQKISEKKQVSKYIIPIIIFGLVSGSFLYLELKVDDYDHEREAYAIANHISKDVKIVNDYSESEYLLASNINNQWPHIPNEFVKVEIVSIKEMKSMEELLRTQELRLTDIIIDDNRNQPEFLQELLNDEKTYPYLIKKFDSRESGYEYHVKVFQIDYEQFDQYMRDLKINS